MREFRKSSKFKKQVKKYGTRFHNINKDIDDAEDVLEDIAFRQVGMRNCLIAKKEITGEVEKEIWRLRLSNSDTNKGKSCGYRIFYCRLSSEKGVLFLGIYFKPDVDDVGYSELVNELLEAAKEQIFV